MICDVLVAGATRPTPCRGLEAPRPPSPGMEAPVRVEGCPPCRSGRHPLGLVGIDPDRLPAARGWQPAGQVVETGCCCGDIIPVEPAGGPRWS